MRRSLPPVHPSAAQFLYNFFCANATIFPIPFTETSRAFLASRPVRTEDQRRTTSQNHRCYRQFAEHDDPKQEGIGDAQEWEIRISLKSRLGRSRTASPPSSHKQNHQIYSPNKREPSVLLPQAEHSERPTLIPSPVGC